MLSERSHSQKTTYYTMPCIGNVQNRDINRDRRLELGVEVRKRLGGRVTTKLFKGDEHSKIYGGSGSTYLQIG